MNIFPTLLCHKEVLANQNFSEQKLQTQYGTNFQNQLVNVESFTIITTDITGNVNLIFFKFSRLGLTQFALTIGISNRMY